MSGEVARGAAVLDPPRTEPPPAVEAVIREARRRRRRRRLAIGVVLLLFLGGVGVAFARGGGDDTTARGRDGRTSDAARTPAGGTASPRRAPRTSVAGSWAAITPTPTALQHRFFGLGDAPVAVGAGADVFVLPSHVLGDGLGLLVARYTPARGSWTVFARAPIVQRANAITLWDGHELLVWGGTVNGSEGLRDGAALDPRAGRWRMIADAPVELTDESAAVWTGSEVIVWGGGHGRQGAGGYAYDPAADAWRALPGAPITNRPYPSAVWTGSEVIVWGGCAPSPPGNPGPCDAYAGTEPTDGAAYDPALDSWRRLAPSPLPPRPRPSAVWTGTEMIVWGGDVGPAPAGEVGAVYDPTADTWRPLRAAPFPSLRDVSLYWSGTALLVVGGRDGGGGSGNAAYDPRSEQWTFLPPPPFGWGGAASAWTDEGLVGIGGSTSAWRGALLPRE
jgi:hypothetical protein